MRVAVLFGSPRKKGNTARILEYIRDEMTKHAPGMIWEELHLNEMTIHGCQGCNVCQKKAGEPGCAVHDDMERVYQALVVEADIVFVATPVYMWGVTGQTKVALDRLHACKKHVFFDENLLKGKAIAWIGTLGGGIYEGAETSNELLKFSQYFEMKRLGDFVVPGADDKNMEDFEKEARAFAREII